ncbi:MAG: PAS domain-containing protein [Thermodesulfovibrionales bacterium]|nr:PAS domain-containing protein [Thermodesulfovibrionales bacterium]
MRQSILKPILQLKNMAKAMEQWNLDTKVEIKSRDEIGELGDSFNNMARSISMLFDENIKHMREMDVLNKLSSALSSSLSVDEVLNIAINEILNFEILKIERKGAIMLLDEHAKTLKLGAQKGLPEGHPCLKNTMLLGECLCGIAVETSKTVTSYDAFKDIRHVVNYPGMTNHGHIVLPLKSKDNVLGAICLYLPPDVELSNEEIRLYELIADIVSVSLQNALNYNELENHVESLRNIENELRKNQARLSNAQRIAHLGNWDWDIVKNDLWWSDEIYSIFGLSKDKFGKTYEAFLNSVHPEDLEFVKTSVNKALYEKIPYSIDHRIVLPNGSVRHVHEQAEVSFDNSGKPIFMAGTVQDMTDYKKLEEQLLHSQKIQAIGQLAGGVAHEFNNILTIIKGYGDIMLMDMGNENPSKFHLTQIMRAAERAEQLTHGLLTFSKKQLALLKPININKILIGIEKLLSKLIKENIKIKTMLTDKDLIVVANAGQIEQILLNLATNAQDAMPKGGILTIVTEVVDLNEEFIKAHGFGELGRYALISVADTGSGFDQNIKERIFEPFFTTKGISKGTGLGLSIVYGIVKQHQGYIDVHSEVGRGSIFNIYLPVTTAKEDYPEKIKPLALAKGKETILLAEDDEDVRNLSKSILEGFGYKVIEAVDGKDAVNKFKDNKDSINLLLFDVIMPGKNGKDAYDEIKKLKPGIKIIFTSGYTADLIQQKQDGEEKLTFIPKPVSPQKLLNTIRELLDG